MNLYKWIDKNCSSLIGKTVAISGSTGGIGRFVCDYLAYLGANIICMDRNTEKSNALINNLKIKYPNLNAKHITLDLEDFVNVKKVTEKIKNFNIDYLILNAGAYKIPRHKCNTGFNNVFQINFLSPYYIAYQLFDKIAAQNGKIVAVSSIAHDYSKIDVNDIDFSTRKASSLVYGNAKRFLTYTLNKLNKNNNTITIVHPGITLTNITAHYPKFIFALIKYPMKIIFAHPKKAALNIVFGMFVNCNANEWIGPKYFNIWGLPKKSLLNTANNHEKKIIEKISNNISKRLF